MTSREFDRIAREVFGNVLAPHGFSCADSKRCTFVRTHGDDVFHVIMPDPGTRFTWYDVNVFPTSPRLHVDFDDRFPDDLGNTLDVWGKLNDRTGIGMVQARFNCKTEDNFRSRFDINVAPLLVSAAIPFLDTIHTYDDLLPHLRGPFAAYNRG